MLELDKKNFYAIKILSILIHYCTPVQNKSSEEPFDLAVPDLAGSK